MTGLPTQRKTNPKSHRAGLVVIASYKLLGALVCIAIGVGALHLVGKDIDDVLGRLTLDLRLPESRFVNFMFDKIELLDDPMLKRIGFAAFSYASLGIIEAVGLYLEKAWGELITLIVTASFLPFEVHEMMRRLTWLRTSLFIINLLVLLYLVWMLGEKAAARRRAADA
jgi:uncharacterized membrane protein (DUF2068 family)